VATTWPNRHDLDATLTLSSLPKQVSFGDDDRSFDFTTAVQAVAWLAQFSAQRRSSWIAEFSVSDIRTARIRYASGKNLEIKRYRPASLFSFSIPPRGGEALARRNKQVPRSIHRERCDRRGQRMNRRIRAATRCEKSTGELEETSRIRMIVARRESSR